MTLATVQRYQPPTRNPAKAGAAIVIGGSMAGLFIDKITGLVDPRVFPNCQV
ncbi:hypothetical protein [Natronosalvus amylolyticus]|uniref:hypothetical protein n=1 Tax=Natronosalvus amylolyticus TaxID=2961994 RepID=UPI0020C9FE61|nr:hypothetical protein [Natronosalvus amylolyticus]